MPRKRNDLPTAPMSPPALDPDPIPGPGVLTDCWYAKRGDYDRLNEQLQTVIAEAETIRDQLRDHYGIAVPSLLPTAAPATVVHEPTILEPMYEADELIPDGPPVLPIQRSVVRSAPITDAVAASITADGAASGTAPLEGLDFQNHIAGILGGVRAALG